MAYFPNGISGMVLDEQCCDCLHENEFAWCPVYAVQSLFNYDQIDKGQEKLRKALSILISDNGKCNVRAAFQGETKNEPLPCMDGLKEWAKKHGVRTI